MSADGWKVCPRCVANWKANIDEATKALYDTYGKVPVEEFDRAREALTRKSAQSIGETFREDYEFYGAADGTVTADYSGGCSKCGLQARLKHSVTFYPETTGGAE